jgi:hypothetical protein
MFQTLTLLVCAQTQIGRKGINMQQVRRGLSKSVDAVRDRIGRSSSGGVSSRAALPPPPPPPVAVPEPPKKQGWF